MNEIKNQKVILNIFFDDYPKLPPKIQLECKDEILNKKLYDKNLNLLITEINPSKWDITINLSKIVNIIHDYILNL